MTENEPITCREIVELASDYLEGTLSPEDVVRGVAIGEELASAPKPPPRWPEFKSQDEFWAWRRSVSKESVLQHAIENPAFDVMQLPKKPHFQHPEAPQSSFVSQEAPRRPKIPGRAESAMPEPERSMRRVERASAASGGRSS